MVEANFSDVRAAGYDPQAWQQLKERALARPLRDRTAAYGCAACGVLAAWLLPGCVRTWPVRPLLHAWVLLHAERLPAPCPARPLVLTRLHAAASASCPPPPPCPFLSHSCNGLSHPAPPTPPTRCPHPSVVRELLAVLRDPYSRFVTPTEFSAMLKYDVSGVGLNLGTAEEFANKTVSGEAEEWNSAQATNGMLGEAAYDEQIRCGQAHGRGVGQLGCVLPMFAHNRGGRGGERAPHVPAPRPASPTCACGPALPAPVQGMPLPEGRDVGSAAGGEGVWVVGLIKGLAADSAGLQQGDQLLELDGQQLQGQSPFQVASLMQGPEAAPEDALGLQGAAVRLKVRRAGADVPAVSSRAGLQLRSCWHTRGCGPPHRRACCWRVHACGPCLGPRRFQQAARLASQLYTHTTSCSCMLSPQVRRFDGSEQAVTLQRPVRVLQSPVSSRLERSAGGEQVGFIRLASFNARAQVGTAVPWNGSCRCCRCRRRRCCCCWHVTWWQRDQPAAVVAPPATHQPAHCA